MNISNKGIELIKKFEGCSLFSYKCPAGVWTIGYGHTGSNVHQGLKISQIEAEKFLKIDLIVHSNNVSKLVKVPLSQNQFDALVSLEYNIGYGNFSKSTLLKLLNSKNYKGAAEQFKMWKMSRGKILSGLVKRRQAEYELFIKT